MSSLSSSFALAAMATTLYEGSSRIVSIWIIPPSIEIVPCDSIPLLSDLISRRSTADSIEKPFMANIPTSTVSASDFADILRLPLLRATLPAVEINPYFPPAFIVVSEALTVIPVSPTIPRSSDSISNLSTLEPTVTAPCVSIPRLSALILSFLQLTKTSPFFDRIPKPPFVSTLPTPEPIVILPFLE